MGAACIPPVFFFLQLQKLLCMFCFSKVPLSLSLVPALTTCGQATTAAQDSTVLLSRSKAKELGVAKGDVVVLVGRRRHATYGKVDIGDGKSTTCSISQNMAANLRLRQNDKIKVEPVRSDEEGERSGDLLLVQKQPIAVASVTFSPVEDSLNGVVASEGGDMLDDSEIEARFVAPYLESGGGLVKKGHLLKLRDENGKRLEFYVTHVTLEGDDDEEKDDTDGMFKYGCLLVV